MREAPNISSENRVMVLEPQLRFGRELLEEVKPRPRKEPIIPRHYTRNIFDKPRNKSREPSSSTKRQAHQATRPVRDRSPSNLARVSGHEINIYPVGSVCPNTPVLVADSFNLTVPQTGVTDQPSHVVTEANLEMNSNVATFVAFGSDFLTDGLLSSWEEVQNDELGTSISREQYSPQNEHPSDIHQILDLSQTAITSSNNTCSHSFKISTVVTCMTCGYLTSPDFSQEMSLPVSRDDNAYNPTQASETAWPNVSAPGPSQYQTHPTMGEPTWSQFQDTIFNFSSSPNINNEFSGNSRTEHGARRCLTRPRLQIPTHQYYRQPPSAISGSTSASSTTGSDLYLTPSSAAFPDSLSPRIDITDFDSVINI